MSLVIRFDGSCEPNPGPASYAVVVEDDEIAVESWAVKIGWGTSNEAEYRGLISALEAAQIRGGPVRIVSDSRLVGEQTNSRWKVKNDRMKVFQKMVHGLLENSPGVTVEWENRESNEKQIYLLLLRVMTQPPNSLGGREGAGGSLPFVGLGIPLNQPSQSVGRLGRRSSIHVPRPSRSRSLPVQPPHASEYVIPSLPSHQGERSW